MKGSEWTKLDDASLEKLLVERWVLRGLVLVAIFAAAVAVTYVGVQGMPTLADRLTVGALTAVALIGGAVVFAMRATDLRMHRELRRRRRG